MIKKYNDFLKNRSKFLGYKVPFDSSNPIAVIERNGIHSFSSDINLINEYNREFETPQGVWRLKNLKTDDAKYIDLDQEDVQIKVGQDYQFLGITFTPQYTDNSYFTTIQPIDNNKDGSDTHPSWVLYADTLDDLEKDIRVNAKLYKQEYNLD